MAAMDEFREEREKIKSQPLKKRLAYFWCYYKWFAIIGVILIVAVISTVYGILTRTTSALYGVVVNSITLGDGDAFMQDFTDYAELDTKKYHAEINASLIIGSEVDETTLNSSQFIMVYMAAQDLDFAVMEPDTFGRFTYNDIYLDLRECFSAEELEAMSDKLYYMDKAVLDMINEMTAAEESTENIALPDPFSPELMEEPVPVGINISGCSKFMDVYFYEGGTAYLGITANSPHVDMVKTFLAFLFD